MIQIPFGEFISIKARFHNKMNFSIDLNNLKLEFQPENKFNILPLSISILGGGYTDVILQASPLELGICQVFLDLLCITYE
jgi:hypothetical protein